MAAMIANWNSAKRIVIKIGSSLLVNTDDGTVKADWLESLAEDISDLKSRGKEIIIVSSGAIALGKKSLSLTTRALRLEENQAAASVGQIALAHLYQEVFKSRDMVVAQILLTLGYGTKTPLS